MAARFQRYNAFLRTLFGTSGLSTVATDRTEHDIVSVPSSGQELARLRHLVPTQKSALVCFAGSAALLVASFIWVFAGYGGAPFALTLCPAILLFYLGYVHNTNAALASISLTRFEGVLQAESYARQFKIDLLSEELARLRQVIDAGGDIFIQRDDKGRIVEASPAFGALLHRGSVKGLTLGQLGIDLPAARTASSAVGGIDEMQFEIPISTVHGARWFEWHERTSFDEAAQTVSHRAIARDISERRRNDLALVSARERAELANEAKSRFLATVSHEIRTPMNGIMGMAGLLAETRLSAEQRTYVNAVSTSSTALLALIEDLLDFAKIETGRFHVQPQAMSVGAVVESVIELLASKAHHKRIGLGYFIAPDVPAVIESDPGRLRQVLVNLVSNALKFTDAGGIAVTLTFDAQMQALNLEVRDSGYGIAAEDMERIFEEFSQVDTSSTRKHDGVGLGLSICREIMQALGGSIRVESTLGEGSTFIASLPVQSVEPVVETLEIGLSGRAVLIVHSSLLEAQTLAASIKALGGHAQVVQTVEQASLDGSLYDTVIIESSLEIAHPEVIVALRSAGTLTDDAKSIVMITPEERGKLGNLRSLGYDSFLVRPVRNQTLARLLSQPFAEERLAVSANGRSALPEASRMLRILLAEDNDINALLVKATLSKAGHTVVHCRNGYEAVELMAEHGPHAFDAVLMDMHMPLLDGTDAVARIRAREKSGQLPAVPIFILSADGQDAARDKVSALGISGYLLKPISPTDLLAQIDRIVTRS